MKRKRVGRPFAVTPVFASNADAPTLHELQRGEGAGALASLLVALVRQRQQKEMPERS